MSEVSLLMTTPSEWSVPTNAHDDKEASQESAKVHYSTSSTLHKVIMIRCSSAEPVWYRSDDIGRDNEKGKVVLPQGGREDDEEEADCEDLYSSCEHSSSYS